MGVPCGHSGFRFEGGDGGGGGGTGSGSDAEKLAELQKWLDDQTAGIRGNRDTILEEKRGVVEELRQLKDLWKGLDPERVRNIIAKFENNEEMKLIEAGEFEKVIEMRTENMRKGLEAKLGAATDRITELEGLLTGKDETITVLKVDSQVREIGIRIPRWILAGSATPSAPLARSSS